MPQFKYRASGTYVIASQGTGTGAAGYQVTVTPRESWVGSLVFKQNIAPPGSTPNYVSVAYQDADTAEEVAAGTAITATAALIISPTVGDLVVVYTHTSGEIVLNVNPATTGVTNSELRTAFLAAGYETAGQDTPDAMLSVAVADMLGTQLNVKAFGAVGDGVTDDTAAIQAALTAVGALSTVTGSLATLEFSPGVYRCSGASLTGSSARIVGYGATLVQTTDAPSLSLKGGWTTTTVSSIASVSYDFGGGFNTACSRVTVASLPAGIAVGRWVRVVSDDQISGTRAATGSLVERRGEFALVGAIVGNDVYLTGVLQETYTTTPRLALLADVSFEVSGISFDTDDAGDAADWTEAQLFVRAAHSCRFLDIRCVRGWSWFANFVGLRGYLVRGWDVRNLTDSPADNRFGYGINDVSSDGAVIEGCQFGDVRHGVTTTGFQIAADSPLIEYYGRSTGGRVTDCVAVGTSSHAFDTHLAAWDWQFSHCRASMSADAGYNARGKHIRFVECVADRCARGFYVTDDSVGSAATDYVTIKDCIVILATEQAFSIGATDATVTIDGGWYQANGVSGSMVITRTAAGTTRLQGGAQFVQSSTANDVRIIRLGTVASTVDVTGDIVCDLTGASGSGILVAAFAVADATMSGFGRIRVLRGAQSALSTVFEGVSAGQGVVAVQDIIYDKTPSGVMGANLQSGVARQVLGYPFPFDGVSIDANSAKITIDGTNGTVAAGSIGIAEADGALLLSSRANVGVLLDNDNSGTTGKLSVFRNGTTPGTATEMFVLQEDGALGIPDGITAPGTLAGFALLYVDTADGDLKIKFGDGTVKTIVVDT